MSKIAKTFSFLFLIAVFLKILDITKSLLIASKLGVSNNADVYLSVIAIPDALVILAGLETLRGVINSEYSSLNSKDQTHLVWQSFKNIFTLIFFGAVILQGIIFLFRSHIVRILLPGFTFVKYEKALDIATIIFPIFFLKSLIPLFSSLFNSFKKFYFPMITSAIVTIFVIISFFLPYYNKQLIYNLSWGNLTGNVFYCFVLIIGIYKIGGRLKLSRIRMDPITKNVIINCATTFILMFCNQLYLTSRNFFASYFEGGSISSLNYAGTVSNVIYAIIFASVFSALLSNLSTLATVEKREKIKGLFMKTFTMLIFLSIPLVIFFIVYSTEILTLIYKRGNFTISDIQRTQKPYYWEILSIITFILYIVPTALYLAKKKYVMLTMIGSISYLLGILLNYLLSSIYGYYGISMSGFITGGLHGITLLYFARIFFGRYYYYLKKLLVMFLCGLMSIVVLFGFKNFIEYYYHYGDFLSLLLFSFLGFIFSSIIYIVLSSVLKVNYLKIADFKELIQS